MPNTTELQTTLMRLTESACQDDPQRPSVTCRDGYFHLTIKGNQNQWAAMCQAAGVPADAEQFATDDQLDVRWPSYADEIFGPSGLLAQALGPAYEVRAPQLHMARLIQRSIEMDQPAVIEAGTGVGKSFAYAAITLRMNKRIVVSTSNKALQMQLFRKDIPFLQRIFPHKTVALAVGKRNYVCKDKVENPATGAVKIPDAQLRDWYFTTTTGNVEELDFQPDWQELAAMTVDDDCSGKHCPLYAACFYYAAKAARQNVDILITNHALTCLHLLYPPAQILPPYDLLVIDEAHKLPDYARNALGVELNAAPLRKAITKAEPYVAFLDTHSAAQQGVDALWAAAHDICAASNDTQVAIRSDATLTAAATLAQTLTDLADEVWPEDELPTNPTAIRQARVAQRLRTKADDLAALATPGALVRWIDQSQPALRTFNAAPSDVSVFLGQLAGVQAAPGGATDHTHCQRCRRELTAQTVHVLEGRPYGPDCIRKVDAFGDAEVLSLVTWLATQHDATPPAATASNAVIFCSATLAAPNLGHFLCQVGLPDALQMVAASPFDYQANALLYLPNGTTPTPSSSEWPTWAIDELRRLVGMSRGGAFLLFTSNKMLRNAAGDLRREFENLGLRVFVQGELPKLEIAAQFRQCTNGVLFATKSFFEGVSIDGDALRLVVVDKMPFEAPTPLGTAMEADMLELGRSLGYSGRKLEMYPFDALRVPRMVIELKQAAGRLIRTQTDKGVIAILDSRIRATQYGRNAVLPALPPAPQAASHEHVRTFFQQHFPADSPTIPAAPSPLLRTEAMPPPLPVPALWAKRNPADEELPF